MNIPEISEITAQLREVKSDWDRLAGLFAPGRNPRVVVAQFYQLANADNMSYGTAYRLLDAIRRLKEGADE